MARPRAAGLGFLVTGSLLACAQPAKVKIDPAKVQLFDSGASKIVNVTVLDQKGRPMDKPKLKFSSSNPEVAEVDGAGKVMANSTGDAQVTVTAGKVSASVPVMVRIAASLKLDFRDKSQLVSGVQGPANSQVPLLVSGLDEMGKPADLSVATFASSDPKVAVLDQQGVLTILSNGTTDVSVSLGKTKATLRVPVTILVPMAIKLQSPSLTVKAGESSPIPYEVISDAGTTLSIVPLFTSSDPSVAKVDGNGLVTGLSRGSATVSIRAGDASNNVTVSVR
ncbi:MAG: Ig-like domain-containing protein [Acidobacteria bacterium]|nr:Ig-like domain-containing protein [Acidobacteriota bacterium]